MVKVRTKCLGSGAAAVVIGLPQRRLLIWRTLGKGPPWVRRNGRILYPIKGLQRWVKSKRWARPEPYVNEVQSLTLMERLKTLTPRQRSVYAYICGHYRARQVSPTREEIVAAFGFRSPNAAQAHVNALVKKGILLRADGATRGITPTLLIR